MCNNVFFICQGMSWHALDHWTPKDFTSVGDIAGSFLKGTQVRGLSTDSDLEIMSTSTFFLIALDVFFSFLLYKSHDTFIGWSSIPVPGTPRSISLHQNLVGGGTRQQLWLSLCPCYLCVLCSPWLWWWSTDVLAFVILESHHSPWV